MESFRGEMWDPPVTNVEHFEENRSVFLEVDTEYHRIIGLNQRAFIKALEDSYFATSSTLAGLAFTCRPLKKAKRLQVTISCAVHCTQMFSVQLKL